MSKIWGVVVPLWILASGCAVSETEEAGSQRVPAKEAVAVGSLETACKAEQSQPSSELAECTTGAVRYVDEFAGCCCKRVSGVWVIRQLLTKQECFDGLWFSTDTFCSNNVCNFDPEGGGTECP